MRKRKREKFRQIYIWFILLVKRLWRQPAYIGLLALIPILGYAVNIMELGEQNGAAVAVCVEEGTWSGQITEALHGLEEESVLRFTFCEDEFEVERRVMKSEVDCGFVIAADVARRVMERDWAESITVYETATSSITGMAKERISGAIFKLYSEQSYEDYMRTCARTAAEGNAQEKEHGKMNEISQEIVDFAIQAYESHLVDGSTFGFRYMSDDPDSQYAPDTNVISDSSVFPVKGVFAVIIFISGMCGMLEYDTDRREKRFLRIAPNVLTYIVDIWLPTVFVSFAVLICLWISDGIRYGGAEASYRSIISVWSAGMWGAQIGRLLIYQCIVVAYCSILGIFLKRQESVAAAIPILSLGSLVCAPVFVRLATYLPVFTVLEKLFPVTYYLML